MSDPTEPSPHTPAPGLTSGDPLGAPAPTTPYPPGYTSPPPPGAGGFPPGAPGFAPGTFRLSGWTRRAVAAIIDGLVVGILALIILAPLGIGAASIDSDTGVAALVAASIVTVLALVVVGFLYAPVMMARTDGRTLGRMATGIRVVRANGLPMTFAAAAVREVVVKTFLFGVLSSITFGLASLLDVLWPLWDEENRALHDMVVNTRVVRA